MNLSVPSQVRPENLATIYQEFKKDKNDYLAKKTLDLFKKQEEQEFDICFAGHFSAGKSSMINKIMGESLLPQSPIPTSANVVKITAGNGSAKIFFNKEEPIEYREPYDIEEIQNYCMDGHEILRVEISKRTNVIPENVAIIDTPGVDSSNDADRIMTESSLHSVDILFYVMDYNHVQSEVNLSFLKKIQELGKPISIIINQIDKHNDAELSFYEFKMSVEQTLSKWGITPKDIYFTTLMSKDHPSNDFDRVRHDINLLIKEKHTIINKTIENSVRVLVKGHLDWLKDRDQQKIVDLNEHLERLSAKVPLTKEESEEKYQLFNYYKTLDKKVADEFRSTVNSTLNNAYLMPFELREKADLFLESQQPGFKIGLFSSKKKIEAERENRLQDFYQMLVAKMEANIQWKLKDKLLDFIKKYEFNEDKLTHEVQSLSITYHENRLKELIKPGAKHTGEYLLVYTEDVSNDIKKMYRQSAQLIWDKVETILKQFQQDKMEELSKELDSVSKQTEIQKELSNLQNYFNNRENELMSFLSNSISTYDSDQIKQALARRVPVFRSPETVTEKKEYKNIDNNNDVIIKQKTDYHVNEVIDNISKANQLLNDLPGFESICEDLYRKKERLTNRTFTVSLFGAFSAGKSSFANALIGQKVLPVSPNPTTAAIMKISPPNNEHKHKTAIVKLKSEESLLEDLNELIEDVHFTNLSESLQWFNKTDLKQLSLKQKSFLSSLQKGFSDMESSLNLSISISIDDLSKYVAEESYACYVESVELYYDCPITKQGITLVDTPGADSINARHTDVTFEYIKQADAILFVTYYNHAFSKADKDFLIQLGRVKDAFSLDKMFFIVNAVDLAKNQTEIKLVTDYVKERLQNFNIIQPRMYPVSSYLALETKENSGFNQFEDHFLNFINNELLDILVHSAINDIKRAIRQVSSYIDSALLNNDEKKERINIYQSQHEKVKAVIKNTNSVKYSEEIKQKTEKQVYYVNQRFSIEFHDRFKDAVNPSTIKSNGREGKKEVENSLLQLFKDIGKNLEQELRAVSLRMENFIQIKVSELNEELNKVASYIDKNVSLPELDEYALQSPTFDSALVNIDMTDFNKAVNVFNTTKSFFEKDEKQQMRDHVFDKITPYVDNYLLTNKDYIIDHYLKQWDKIVDQVNDKSLLSVGHYYNGLIHSLSEDIDVEKLKKTLQQLQEVSINV